MSIKTLIVDDELAARSNLISKLKVLEPEIVIVGQAASAKEAKDFLANTKIDLMFLDITMPVESGFTLLESIDKIDFEIIFVTAHDDFALQAFQFCASGYVLKPIDVLLLKQTLNYTLERVKNKSPENGIENLKNYLNQKMDIAKLAVPADYGLEFVNADQIMWFEASDGYSVLRMENGPKIVSSKSLSYYAKIVPFAHFVQVHRTYIVNINFVHKYLKTGEVEMITGDKFTVARNRRDDFLNLFKP